jgi:hypothetical protein
MWRGRHASREPYLPLLAPSAPGRSGHGCAYRRTLSDNRRSLGTPPHCGAGS